MVYWKEHNPPHFHVEYAEFKASVRIQDAVIDPRLSTKQTVKISACLV